MGAPQNHTANFMRFPKSTLYCLLPVQFTPQSALRGRLGAHPSPAACEMSSKAVVVSGVPHTRRWHIPLQSALPSMAMARGGCHAWWVTPSSQEHVGTLPGRSPRHTGISPVLPHHHPSTQEEPVGLPGLCLPVRSQGSCCHRTMHPVPCVSLTQEITKGSAFLPPKKAPRKKRGRRFPENLSVKV